MKEVLLVSEPTKALDDDSMESIVGGQGIPGIAGNRSPASTVGTQSLLGEECIYYSFKPPIGSNKGS